MSSIPPQHSNNASFDEIIRRIDTIMANSELSPSEQLDQLATVYTDPSLSRSVQLDVLHRQRALLTLQNAVL